MYVVARTAAESKWRFARGLVCLYDRFEGGPLDQARNVVARQHRRQASGDRPTSRGMWRNLRPRVR